jgi:hypothetical protein
MKLDYEITHFDHNNARQEASCSSLEDAERVAQFLAELYGYARLWDGNVERAYDRIESNCW